MAARHIQNSIQKEKVALVFYSEKQRIVKSIIVHEFLIPYIFGKKLAILEDGLTFLMKI